jgi:hypothetical protein
LKDLIPQFHQFLETEGQQWKEERQEKDTFFEKYFSEQAIGNLEEGTLRELIHRAFNGWTNKDWLFQEMLRSGLPQIQSAFKQLLYGQTPLAERFNLVKKKVRMMGVA